MVAAPAALAIRPAAYHGIPVSDVVFTALAVLLASAVLWRLSTKLLAANALAPGCELDGRT